MDQIKHAAEAISKADAIIVTAGAGMGVDSGLPDFRGDEGFWNEYPEARNLGLDFMSLASPMNFRKDPELAWGFYGHRLNLYRETKPHKGYEILNELCKDLPHHVITSNVDGAFQKANFDAVWEVHGSIHYFQPVIIPYDRAMSPFEDKDDLIVSADDFEIEVKEMRAVSELPNIDGNLLRPNILMFMDSGWLSDREQEQRKDFEFWFENSFPCTNKTVVIECGAGTDISTARSLGENIVFKTGGSLIRINPRDYHTLGQNNIEVPLGALEALTKIKEELNG